tara:strand:+ start:886 stop:1836 length:951 start_codon:yes stop_codon:yes gene_type:complete
VNLKVKNAVIVGYHEIGCIIMDQLLANKINVKLIIGNYQKHRTQTNTWYRDVIDYAKKQKIKVVETSTLDSPRIYKILKKVKPDIIFSSFTGLIFSEKIIKIAKYGCFNFHNADLPNNRGRGAPIFSLMQRKNMTAMTLHWITPKIDRGPIVDQEFFKIEKNDDIKRLYLKHNFALLKILKRQIKNIKYKKLKSKPQKFTNKKINKWIEGTTDLVSFRKMKFEEINAIVNSLKYPFKGAASYLKNKLIKIHDLKKNNEKIKGKFLPGEIVKIKDFDLIVKITKGSLLIKELEYQGRHMLPSHLANLINLKKKDRFY